MRWIHEHELTTYLVVIVGGVFFEGVLIGLWHSLVKRGRERPREIEWDEAKREFLKERQKP